MVEQAGPEHGGVREVPAVEQAGVADESHRMVRMDREAKIVHPDLAAGALEGQGEQVEPHLEATDDRTVGQPAIERFDDSLGIPIELDEPVGLEVFVEEQDDVLGGTTAGHAGAYSLVGHVGHGQWCMVASVDGDSARPPSCGAADGTRRRVRRSIDEVHVGG